MKKISGVYLKLLFSYLIVLGIPIIAAMIIYGYTVSVIRDQERGVNQRLLESVRTELDQEIEGIQKAESRLCLDVGIQSLARVSGELSGADRMDLYYLYQDLISVSLSEDFMEDLFVYFNNTQKVCSINGSMDADLYYDLYYDNEDYSFDQFRQYMGELHYHDVLCMSGIGGRDVVLFTMTSLDTSPGEGSATICFAVTYDRIREHLFSTNGGDGMRFLILSPDGSCIKETNVLNDLELNYEELGEGSYLRDDILAERCMVTVMDSARSDWKYVTVTPLSIVDGDAKKVQYISLAGLFLCIVCGFGFSYILTKKNYNPLQVILDTFQRHGNRFEPVTGTNEYQWLNQQIEHFFQEHVDTQRMLNSNKKHLKQYYLTKLLQEYYDGKRLEQYDIHLDQGYNIVILISPRQRKGKTVSMEEQALQRFIILNIFQEMCLNHFNIEILEMGETVASIVNLSDPDTKYLDILKEQIENLQQMTTDSFGFECQVLQGPACQGMAGIHESYQGAAALEEYVHLLDELFICYDDVKDSYSGYDYPVEVEQNLLRTIAIGEGEAAEQMLNEVFARNLSGKVSANTYRCLVYDLIGTLLKGANMGEYEDAAKEIVFPDARSVRVSVPEMEEELRRCLKEICRKVRETRKETTQDHSYSRKIEEYIRENYQNPDLNISITSQYFEKTPAYLSSIYKKQTGRSLLDYINTLRLDHAEELLKQGLSVVEAAEQSGFRDSGSLIRAFKKKKGITPGQLKKKS